MSEVLMAVYYPKKYLVSILLGSAFLFATPVYASTVYSSRASAKTEEAALEKLQVSALRESIQNIIPPEVIKDNVKVIRSEIFLHVKDFTSVDMSEVKYLKGKSSVEASGKVLVDEDAILKRLASCKGFKGLSEAEVAGDPDAGKIKDTGAESKVGPKTGDVVETLITPKPDSGGSAESTVKVEKPADTGDSTAGKDSDNASSDSTATAESSGTVSPDKKDTTATQESPADNGGNTSDRKAATPEKSDAAGDTSGKTADNKSDNTSSQDGTDQKAAPASNEQSASPQSPADGNSGNTSSENSGDAADTAGGTSGSSDKKQPDTAAGDKASVSSGKNTGSDSTASGRQQQNAMSEGEFRYLVRSRDKDRNQKIIDALNQGMNPNGNPEADGLLPPLYDYINSHGRDPEVIKTFIKSGADIMWHNKSGDYKVMKMLFFTSDEVIEFALDYVKPDLSNVKSDDDYPLIEFLGRNSFISHSKNIEDTLRVLDKIIKLGGLKYDPANPKDMRRLAVIHSLNRNGDSQIWPVEVMKMIINAGGDVNAENKYGKTALFIATEENAVDHIRLLASKGANMNAVNQRGETALIDFMSDDQVTDETLMTLIDSGADVNYASAKRNNLTPLIAAVKEERIKVVEHLLKHGANPDMVVKNGRTALMFAITTRDENKRHELMKLLLDAKASQDIKDNDGGYPLCYGIGTGSVETIELLVSYGGDLAKAADVRIPGRKGEPAKTLYETVMESKNSKADKIKKYLKEKLNR
ncbi:MAG: ankyrin repeat domain-containing protein [Ruminobacter sp.]|nr:ankyrin repeat domain-containing protein [Ruminobacter sp.]